MSEFKYIASLDLTNFNNSHTLAFHFAVASGRPGLEVLEVGCSAGYFGESLKRLGHYVVGVEPDQISAEKAADVLDEVYCGFVESFFDANAGRAFDVISFGDVLEHLADPLSVLKVAKRFLKPDGRLIVSVPNVAHASVRAMLLGGKWTYSDLGILDRTHLRFFTKTDLIALLEDAGFDIEFIKPVQLGVDEAAQMCGLSLSPDLVRQVEQVGDDALYDFQYVVSAKVGDAGSSRISALSGKRLKRVFVLSDDPLSTITGIRLRTPLERVAWDGWVDFEYRSYKNFSLSDLKRGDVFVLQRGYSARALNIAQIISSQGKPFVYELDDLLTEIPDFLGHHVELRRGRSNILACLQLASLVTVTTERLADALGVFKGKVVICPNYGGYLSHCGGKMVEHVAADPVTLIVASSDRVMIDFIVQPLKFLAKKYGHRLNVVCIGDVGPKLKSEGIEAEFHPILSRDDFDAKIRALNNAVGVIPLDDSRFSACKSAVKYFDYTSAGCVVACSNVPPYRDVISSGVNGVLVDNDSESWINALSRLIDDAGLRQRMAANALETVQRDHSLSASVNGWKSVFARILDGSDPTLLPAAKAPSLRCRLLLARWRLQDMNRTRRAKRKQAKLSRRSVSPSAV
jgi:2-polyprenyl-3-methyl-5-hydroxy-6-metoxy-1,4-benzoquinol methylase